MIFSFALLASMAPGPIEPAASSLPSGPELLIAQQETAPSNSEDSYKQSFIKGVLDSCKASPSSEISSSKSRDKYCPCYASIFSRYTDSELKAINSLALESDRTRTIVRLMIEPERRVCAQKIR